MIDTSDLDSSNNAQGDAPISRHPVEAQEEFSRAAGDVLLTRLSYLESLDHDVNERLPAHMLAARIGTYDGWVYRLVNEFGLESELAEYQGRITPCYPSFTLPLLKDEYEWRKELRSLPPLLTITELAEHIGRSWAWTTNALARLAVKPTAAEMRSSIESELYNKNVLKKLRKISMEFPMEDGWHNMGQLVIASGEDREWIEGRLAEAGVRIEIRRSALTGKLYEFYPPDAIVFIEKAKLERPGVAADGWMTAEAIPNDVGRSYNWCRTRLEEYRQMAVLRQDSQGVSRLHYPPSVTSALIAEKQSIDGFSEPGDLITFSAVAEELGRSRVWVRKQMNKITVDGVMCRDKKGRVREYYPRSVIQQISSLAE